MSASRPTLLLPAAFAMLFAAPAVAEDLQVLFLGDNGHHLPQERFAQLAPALAPRGIRLVYTDRIDDLNPANLRKYDALAVYANIDAIGKPQADAVLEYVSGGGGFVPLHCATYCFRNDPRIVALMGAQFKRHGAGVFRAQRAESDHPLMRGFGGQLDGGEIEHEQALREVRRIRALVDEVNRELGIDKPTQNFWQTAFARLDAANAAPDTPEWRRENAELLLILGPLLNMCRDTLDPKLSPPPKASPK